LLLSFGGWDVADWFEQSPVDHLGPFYFAQDRLVKAIERLGQSIEAPIFVKRRAAQLTVGRHFLTRLLQLYDAGKLAFFGSLASLTDPPAFRRYLATVRKTRWVVYAKAPFAGPEAVLAYLSRYTHHRPVSVSPRRVNQPCGDTSTPTFQQYRSKAAWLFSTSYSAV
jgi:hypothetical protein